MPKQIDIGLIMKSAADVRKRSYRFAAGAEVSKPAANSARAQKPTLYPASKTPPVPAPASAPVRTLLSDADAGRDRNNATARLLENGWGPCDDFIMAADRGNTTRPAPSTAIVANGKAEDHGMASEPRKLTAIGRALGLSEDDTTVRTSPLVNDVVRLRLGPDAAAWLAVGIRVARFMCRDRSDLDGFVDDAVPTEAAIVKELNDFIGAMTDHDPHVRLARCGGMTS